MKVLSKYLLGLLLFIGVGLTSFSNSFYAHNYLILNGTVSSPNAVYESKTVQLSLNGYSGPLYFIITMGSSCSQYSVFIGGNSYDFSNNSSLNSCISPLINVDSPSDLVYYSIYYRSSSSSTPYVRATIIDKDTFDTSFKYNVSFLTGTNFEQSNYTYISYYVDGVLTGASRFDGNRVSIYMDSGSVYSYNNSFSRITISKTCPTCEDKLTSEQCQSEYSLIPISSVDNNYCENNNLCNSCPSCPTIDQNYCVSNGLCPIIDKSYCEQNFGLIDPSECPSSGEGTGDISWSALWINNIQHLGSPIIRVSIPSEIEWNYTRSDSEFDLNIEGLNGDEDYINGIISVQNYKPSSEDFSQVFSNLVPYMKIIIFILFVFLVWKWIRKLFK